MGVWETAIYNNDTSCDVRDEFNNFLKQGVSAEEASKVILEKYHHEFEGEEDLEVMSLV